MRYKLFFFLIALISSCTTSNIVGRYNRAYKISTAVMTETKKETLIINKDSSFIWIDYKNEFSKFDSSLTYGIIKSTDGSKLYVLNDTVTNTKFCLSKNGEKLYFYNCSQGKKYRYPNPFIKEDHN